jgi:hypothetical protein
MSVAKNFEKLLKDFFSLYHPRQVKKTAMIVQEFKGKEIILLKTLCEKYKKPYTSIPGLNEELEELYADSPELEIKTSEPNKEEDNVLKIRDISSENKDIQDKKSQSTFENDESLERGEEEIVKETEEEKEK